MTERGNKKENKNSLLDSKKRVYGDRGATSCQSLRVVTEVQGAQYVLKKRKSTRCKREEWAITIDKNADVYEFVSWNVSVKTQ